MKSLSKKKGLGQGLNLYFGDSTQFDLNVTESIQVMPIANLKPGKYQPRGKIDKEALNELAASIQTQGLIQPLLVRSITNGYEIIAGERRFKAAQIAGLKEVPVIIKQVNDQTAAAIALIENIQREDLNPLEEARGINRLIQEFNYTHEKAAEAIGKSRSAVSNLLRLLSLAEPVQTMLLAGNIDMGHARALVTIDAAKQIMLANEIISRHLSVREVEKLITKQSKPIAQKKVLKRNQDIAKIEEELSDNLSAIVKIIPGKKNKGKIIIEYASLDDLDRLLVCINPESREE